MKLTRLDLHRSRGLNNPYTLEDLSPNVNIVVGSNGSGKSSLCRAISGLLWETDDFQGSVSADWIVDGSELPARRVSGTAPRWGRDGEAPHPALPEARFRGCFSFSVDDFLSDKETDKQIENVIRTELLAGYDLSEVLKGRRSLNAAAATVARLKNQYVEAAKQAELVRDQHRNLFGDERKLGEHRDSLKAALGAVGRTPLHAAALELASKRLELEQAREDLATYPQAIETLRGDELKRIESLRSGVSTLEQDIARLGEDGDALRAELQETRLEKPLPKERLKVLQTRERNLQRLAASCNEAEKHAAQAEAHLEKTRAVLEVAGVSPAPAFGSDVVRELEALLSELEALEARCASAEDRAPAVEEGIGATAPEAPLEAAIGLLARWLEGGNIRGFPRVASFAMVGTGALLFVLGLAGELGSTGSVVAGVVLAAAGLLSMFRKVEGKRRLWVEEFEALPLDPPSAWEASSVVRRMGELRGSLVDQQARNFETESARRAQRDLEGLYRQRQALRENLAKVSQKCGLNPDCTRLGLVAVAQELQRKIMATHELADAHALEEQARAEFLHELSLANGVLGRYGFEEVADDAQVRAAAEVLGEREASRLSSSKGLEVNHGRATRTQQDLALKREELTAFLRSLKLEEGGEVELARRLEHRAAWKDASDLVEVLQREIKRLEARLKDTPELMGLGISEAERAKAENDARADDLKRLQEQVTKIDHAVALARGGHELEDAMALEESAREALSETRDDLIEAAATEFLLAGVARDHQNLAQPDILRNAGRYFEEFTRHLYKLESAPYSDGGLPFEIRETEGHAKELLELSSGTRSQLGLALRLAVAQSVEVGETLPILLDEALTNSDPQRFRDVVDSLNQLAEEGRQIFFFTADPKDATEVESVLSGLGASRPRRYDLNQLRGEGRAAESVKTEPLPEVPAPLAVEAPDAYATRLRVPRIDAFAGVDALHLYYLCSDDLDGLHEVLLQRVDSVGKTRSLLAAHPEVWRAERRKRFEVRRTIVATWLDDYQVGRTLPVTPEILRAGPLGKSAFIEALVEMNGELEGNAMALLSCIDTPTRDRDKRLRGFKKGKRDDLRDDLEARGLFTESQPRAPAERRELCLTAAQSALGEDLATREEIDQLVNALEQWIG